MDAFETPYDFYQIGAFGRFWVMIAFNMSVNANAKPAHCVNDC